MSTYMVSNNSNILGQEEINNLPRFQRVFKLWCLIRHHYSYQQQYYQ